MGLLSRLGIAPQQDQFYRLLLKQAANTHKGALRLLELLENYQDPELGEKERLQVEQIVFGVRGA